MWDIITTHVYLGRITYEEHLFYTNQLILLFITKVVFYAQATIAYD